MLCGNRKIILLVCACGLLLFGSATHAQRLRVGFLCPEPEDDPFWGLMVHVMQAVAKDLDIELIVNCTRLGSLATKRAGNALLQANPPLDYFITGYWGSITRHHLAMANSNAIKTFVINSRVLEEDQAEVGSPRGRLKNWLGHMVPDDKQAAIDMTKALVDMAGKVSGNIEILALIGDGKSPIGSDRIGGLRSQVQASPAIKLRELSRDYWAVEWAAQDTTNVLRQHTGTSIIWGMNQSAAWGGLLGAEKAGRQPGKDIFVGGFDWNPDSIKAIADGRMSASMFGHFMEGAWALLLVHDHYHGFDFAKDKGAVMSTPLTSINAANYDRYAVILQKAFWENVDFRKLSKKYNPELKSYNFNINQFLN
jgi:ABC-type sugar transport system substrate-binding protein